MTTSAGRHTTTPDAANVYTFAQTYDTIHNIARKTQTNEFKSSVQPHTTYDYTFTYPGSGTARPHGAVAIGPFDILHDAIGNHTRTTERGTSNIDHYVFDEENRLACVHKGQQVPSPSCDEQGINPLEFIYDHAGVRRRKDASNLQRVRRRATSGRSCSAARRLFFVAQVLAVDEGPHRAVAGKGAVLGEFRPQGPDGDVRLGCDPVQDKGALPGQSNRRLPPCGATIKVRDSVNQDENAPGVG